MYQPRYLISQNTLKAIGSFEVANELIRETTFPGAWQESWKRQGWLKTIHYSTQLEGNNLPLAEVDKIMDIVPARDQSIEEIIKLAQLSPNWSPTAVQEVVNYYHALEYVDQLLASRQDSIPLVYSSQQLLQLHALLTEHLVPPHEGGVWRQVRVVIKNEAGETIMQPPPAVEISFQMEDLFGWLVSPDGVQTHPIIKTGLLYSELWRIQPFLSSSGKTIRAFVDLVLGNEGANINHWWAVEEYLTQNWTGYYQKLVDAVKTNDQTAWVEFFASGCAASAQIIRSKIVQIKTSQASTVAANPVPLNQRQVKLIEELKGAEWVGMNEVKKILPMVSDDTVLRDLNDLIKKGLIKRKGKTKGALYSLA